MLIFHACIFGQKCLSPPPQKNDRVLRLWRTVSAKLHYTDTGYGHVVQHHQRTSSQQFYNLLYNKFAALAMPEPNISTYQDISAPQIRRSILDFVRVTNYCIVLYCWDVANFCPLVVNLLYNKLQNCCELVRWWCCTTCPQPVSV